MSAIFFLYVSFLTWCFHKRTKNNVFLLGRISSLNISFISYKPTISGPHMIFGPHPLPGGCEVKQPPTTSNGSQGSNVSDHIDPGIPIAPTTKGALNFHYWGGPDGGPYTEATQTTKSWCLRVSVEKHCIYSSRLLERNQRDGKNILVHASSQDGMGQKLWSLWMFDLRTNTHMILHVL